MTVLILAPHADDEIIGMGGTICRFRKKNKRVVVAIMTGHGKEDHPLWGRDTWDKVREEARLANELVGTNELIFRDLPAACLDALPVWQINKAVSDVIEDVKPTEVYVPFLHDLHKDHNAIAYAALVACRPYLPLGKRIERVLAYEVLSETHLAAPYMFPPFQPNVFFDITDEIDIKLKAFSMYQSQLQPDNMPRSLKALRSLATLRGTHIGVSAAEGFVLLREAR